MGSARRENHRNKALDCRRITLGPDGYRQVYTDGGSTLQEPALSRCQAPKEWDSKRYTKFFSSFCAFLVTGSFAFETAILIIPGACNNILVLVCLFFFSTIKPGKGSQFDELKSPDDRVKNVD